MSDYRFNVNNFDLIRLFAAVNVAFHHSMKHLHIEYTDWLVVDLTYLFPGVPVFFFISGFLISKSFEKNSIIPEYAKNRAIRLFPGLIVCGAISVILITLSGYLKTVNVSTQDIFIWILSQVTFFQFFDPDFLSGYGIGQVNGSLWTVFIEIQFYILIPLLYLLFSYIGQKGRNIDLLLLILTGIFLLVHRYYYFYSDNSNYLGIIKQLLGISFAPYFYMFLVGVIFQKNFDLAYKYLSGRFFVIVLLYIVIALYLKQYWSVVAMGNNINPFLYILLCCVVFSCAFSYRELSGKLLKKNDISYGIYIYHMPVVNLFMFLGLVKSQKYLAVAGLITFILAIFSWVLIEKPCMRLKSHPLNPFAKES